MADAATTPQSTVTGVEDSTPLATKGFGPREYADTARQAAGNALAVAPVDISMQDVIARSQALTFDALGKSFASNADLREKMADANSDWREIQKGKLFGKV